MAFPPKLFAQAQTLASIQMLPFAIDTIRGRCEARGQGGRRTVRAADLCLPVVAAGRVWVVGSGPAE